MLFKYVKGCITGSDNVYFSQTPKHSKRGPHTHKSTSLHASSIYGHLPMSISGCTNNARVKIRVIMPTISGQIRRPRSVLIEIIGGIDFNLNLYEIYNNYHNKFRVGDDQLENFLFLKLAIQCPSLYFNPI